MSREHFCSKTSGWEPLVQTSFAIYVEIYYLLLYHQLFLMWKEKPIFKTLQKKLPLNLCKYLQIIGFFVVPYKLWNWIELFFFLSDFFPPKIGFIHTKAICSFNGWLQTFWWKRLTRQISVNWTSQVWSKQAPKQIKWNGKKCFGKYSCGIIFVFYVGVFLFN